MARGALSPWLLWILAAGLIGVEGVQPTTTNPRIIEHPEDQFVAKNEPATLNCKAEGEPPPLITWYRNNMPVITANENPSSHRMLLPSGQLFFLRIIHNKNNKPDVGVYHCVATNPETKVSVRSKNATLEIAVLRDDFRLDPRNTEVAVGDTAILECRPPKGLPEPRIKWKKDKDTLHPNGRITIQETGNLVIQNSRHEDSGVYVCVAHNKAGDKESNPARLEVMEKPKFMKSPQDITVEENEDIEFQCRASGDPEPTIIWKRKDGAIPQGRSDILEDRSLKIEKVKVSDEGTYICRAENSVGYVEALARLTVLTFPSFLVTPQNKVVGVGRMVSLRCEVTGNPRPAVFWNKDASQVLMFPNQDNGRFSVTEEGTLIIEPVRKEDAGEYVCQAYSVAGSAFAKARIEVKDVDPRPPPIIHQGPQNQTLPVNTVAMLQCHSSGDPPPSIRWYKNNRPLSSTDPRVAILDSGTLQISDLKQMDSGMYTCKAISETGETSWSAALTVEVPSNPSVIFHRTPEPSTFPGPPSKPMISEVTDSSMRLTWKANANHGASPVYAYTVEYFSHETGEGWIVASDGIKGQSYVVRGLRPDTNYMFLVRSRNTHGLSLPSEVSGPFKTAGGNGKARPTLAQFDIALVSEKLSNHVVQMKQPEVISSADVKLNWDILKAHRFIEGFHIKYRVMPNPYQHITKGHRHHHHHVEYTIETISGGSATMYVLRNLHKFTWYEVRVQPFYLTVEGQESNTVRFRTFEDVPSAPPQNIVANLLENETSNTLSLSWSAPPREDHNGPLRGYKIRCFGNETRFNRNKTTNASTHHILLEHMVKGMAYRIQLAAFNKMGTGVWSDPYIVGAEMPQGLVQGFVKEPWFIATLIGIIGGTLWFALCFFSVWLYRKRRARKKLHKNGVMNVPVHKAEDTSRLGPVTNQTPLLSQHSSVAAGSTGNHANQMCVPPCCADDMSLSDQSDPQHVNGHLYASGYQHLESMHQPDVSNMSKEDQMKENLYNTPSIAPPMKTFYNKNNPLTAPYATTTLVTGNNLLNKPNVGSAFRPIQKGYTMQGGSNDSGVKNDGSSNESNHDNLGDEDAHRRSLPKVLLGPKQPVLFLPPPPEHPPPSDIGTPPDSPTLSRCVTPPSRMSENSNYHMPPVFNGQRTPLADLAALQRNGTGPYSDSEYRSFTPGTRDTHNRSFSPRSLNEKWTPASRGVSGDYNNQAPPEPQQPHRPNSPSKCRTMSPRSHMDRSYSPRAMSEPERGPTPPIRAYKLIPIKDHELHRHLSDTEGAPIPPIRMINHTPPSPAPDDPMMDRACQSSLPSLVSECINPMQRHGRDSPVSEGLPEYVGDSDMEQGQRDCNSPGSSVGGDMMDNAVTGSLLASWASVTDNSNSSCSSARSSALSSSDGSFFAEADFAKAVAKAAELSGLTVVGSTVVDPNAGRDRDRSKGKVKKPFKHRERAKRPTSPYSTDSNYSSVQVPHRPYPKSERKRQLQEQASKYSGHRGERHGDSSGSGSGKSRPIARPRASQNGESHMSEMPSYYRPSFPSPCGPNGNNNLQSPSRQFASEKQRSASTPKSPNTPNGSLDSSLVLRQNPMALAFDKDTPIV